MSPNLVEPESYITDEETNSVTNSCAVRVPVTVKLPVRVSVVLSRYDDVAAVKLAIDELLVVIDEARELLFDVIVDAKEALLETISLAIEALVEVNDPDMSSAICAELESAPTNIPVNLDAVMSAEVF